MEPLVFFRCHSSNSSGGGIAKSVVVREFFGFLTIPPVSVVPFDLGCDANKGDEIVLGVVHFRIHRQSWNTYIEEVFAGVGVGSSGNHREYLFRFDDVGKVHELNLGGR